VEGSAVNSLKNRSQNADVRRYGIKYEERMKGKKHNYRQQSSG
jgi:hypothetical protein